MIQLNYRDSKPIYEQIKDGLRKLVISNSLSADEKLPSVRELAAKLAINPNTIQKAYRDLESEGYIYTVTGKGTFVAEKRIQRNISKGVTGFSEMCRTMGAVPGAKTIKIAIEDPTEKDMELMHITPDKKILVLERIRYADEKPVLLEINRFPESFSFLFGEKDSCAE